MAEIIADSSRQKAGVRNSKKLSTRVDLTPMVDLGFLLITFFIFTTAISKPVAMRVYMPADGIFTPTPASGALTVIPLANDKIFYYHGDLTGALHSKFYGITNYDVDKGIGTIIRNKQLALVQAGKKKEDLMLIIKPTNKSTFENTVNVLDEVSINNIKRYSITSLLRQETDHLEKLGINQ
jgi:biopolymer transport protein ExbD